MADLRIRIAKDKAELVRSLMATTDNHSPFQTYADVVLFAAVLGVKYQRRIPLGEISQREPGPIGSEIFISRGYDPAMKLIAIAATENINIISPNSTEFEQQRLHILEEYANGGLELLQQELRGSVNYTDRILLMLSATLDRQNHNSEEFDLSKFLD
jgi:dnd system-associated protein 4